MIVPMIRAFVACHQRDRDRMLRRLRELGVLHIVPAKSPESDPDGDERDAWLKQVDAALQALRGFEARGPEPRLDANQAVSDVLTIWSGGEAARTRLDALHRELEQLRPWGNVRLADLRALTDAGVDLQVAVVPASAVPDLRARVVAPLEELPRHRQLVATIGLDRETLPRAAELVPLPARDRDAVRAEAARLEATLAAGRERLHELAWLLPRMHEERERLAREQEWAKAVRSGVGDEVMYAVQGWLPTELEAALHAELAREGLHVALRTAPPADDDRPPTLIRYRPWARSIDGLFRILNMVPGYRELDASSVFMIAVPAFAGMIIGDAGYGLLFALGPLLAHRRAVRALGRDLTTLVVLFGVAAVVWGAVTGVWFGLTPAGLAERQGVIGALGHALGVLQLVRGSDEHTRMLLIRICFLIGSAHLMVAHARRFLALAPDLRAFAELGWCAVLGGMLAMIWILFFGTGDNAPLLGRSAVIGLAGGLLLVTWFSHPDRRLGARIGLGLAGTLLPTLSAFSDTLSYIRLMAVGLASYYLGSTFNLLGGAAAQHSWIAGAFVLLAGHTLNIGLTLIAIFAHGVRLNVLEFSSNAGIQWAGYAYQPFSARMAEEQQ